MKMEDIKVGMKIRMKDEDDCEQQHPGLTTMMPYGEICTVKAITGRKCFSIVKSEFDYCAEWFDPVEEVEKPYAERVGQVVEIQGKKVRIREAHKRFGFLGCPECAFDNDCENINCEDVYFEEVSPEKGDKPYHQKIWRSISGPVFYNFFGAEISRSDFFSSTKLIKRKKVQIF